MENVWKMLLRKNPKLGRRNVHFLSENEKEIEVSGPEFIDGSPLGEIELESLILTNTGLRDLNFLSSSPCLGRLESIQLKENKRLLDYSGLHDIRATAVSVFNDANFSDTTAIPETVGFLSMMDTGVKVLEVPRPECMTVLKFSGNVEVADQKQINRMGRLNALELSSLDGVDFAALPLLKSFTLFNASLREFPRCLPVREYRHLCLYYCDFLVSLEGLAGLTVDHLVLVVSGKQLYLFLETLKTMTIRQLTVLGGEVPEALFSMKNIGVVKCP